MRTNIVIDDRLLRDALRATGTKTKREAVELGLRTLLRLGRQERSGGAGPQDHRHRDRDRLHRRRV